MPALTRRSALASLSALAAPALIRPARGDLVAPEDWRLSKETEWPALARRFGELGTQGTLVLLDAGLGGRLLVNPERARAGYLPSSTFKIPNTLIALHTGAAKDVDDEKFAWNGARYRVDGKPLLSEACDAEITLRAAFRNSCIPVFQELARRIGPEAYREWLTRFGYGGGEIGGAPLDEFWLKGDMRVSADDQTKFLRRLVTKTLPVSPRAASLTEEVMFIEKVGDTAIHGKTGYVFTTEPRVGWWVGYAQRGERLALVALNLDMTKPEHGPARYALVKEALKGIGFL